MISRQMNLMCNILSQFPASLSLSSFNFLSLILLFLPISHSTFSLHFLVPLSFSTSLLHFLSFHYFLSIFSVASLSILSYTFSLHSRYFLTPLSFFTFSLYFVTQFSLLFTIYLNSLVSYSVISLHLINQISLSIFPLSFRFPIYL